MLDVLLDTIIDVLKILPFLFIAYLIIELIENKAGDKTTNIIRKSGKFGPVLGGLLGIVPQCGFSTAAANLYAGKIISMGTIIAVFLSTSDEMLPILISEAVPVNLIINILLIKVVISITAGLIVDFMYRKKHSDLSKEEIHKICDDEHCHCEEEGILKASITHTIHILFYIKFSVRCTSFRTSSIINNRINTKLCIICNSYPSLFAKHNKLRLYDSRTSCKCRNRVISII